MYKALYIDSSGRIVQEDNTALEFGLRKMLEGESMEYALISNDNTMKTFVEITPFPIEARGAGTCRLSAKLVSVSQPDAYVVTGAGFAPKQDLNIVGQSAGEVLTFKRPGTSDGTFSAVVAPAVKGKKGGEATFTVADNICSVTIHYKWGDAMTWR
jgi:hypothetical protein